MDYRTDYEAEGGALVVAYHDTREKAQAAARRLSARLEVTVYVIASKPGRFLEPGRHKDCGQAVYDGGRRSYVEGDYK